MLTNNISFVEHAQAVSFVERALYTYERSFVGAFSFTTGLNRLDFDHVENRPFFLAIHRQVMYVREFHRIQSFQVFLRHLATFKGADVSVQRSNLPVFCTLSIPGTILSARFSTWTIFLSGLVCTNGFLMFLIILLD